MMPWMTCQAVPTGEGAACFRRGEEARGSRSLREARAGLDPDDPMCPAGPGPLPRRWCPLARRRHLVDEGQVPLDGGLVVVPLLPQLPAQLLLGLLDPPDGEVPLLHLRGVPGRRRGRESQEGDTEGEASQGAALAGCPAGEQVQRARACGRGWGRGRYQRSLQQPHRLLLLLHLQFQPHHRCAHRGPGLRAPVLQRQPLGRQHMSGRPWSPGEDLPSLPGPLHTWGAEASRSCPNCSISISCRKLMMLCSLASESRVPSSEGPSHVLSFPNLSRLSAVRLLASSSYRYRGRGAASEAAGRPRALRWPPGAAQDPRAGARAGASGEGGWTWSGRKGLSGCPGACRASLRAPSKEAALSPHPRITEHPKSQRALRRVGGTQ